MSDQTTPLTNAVCMHCGYDISGIIPADTGLVTCPECGMQLRHVRSVNALTPKELHTKLATRLLVPTCLIPAAAMLCVCVPGFNLVVAMVMFLLMFILSCLLWMNTTPDLVRQSRIHPRQIPAWRVVLWSILYLVPQAVIAIVYTYIASYYMVYV